MTIEMSHDDLGSVGTTCYFVDSRRAEMHSLVLAAALRHDDFGALDKSQSPSQSVVSPE